MMGKTKVLWKKTCPSATLSTIETMSYMSGRAQKQLIVHYTPPPYFKILQDVHKKLKNITMYHIKKQSKCMNC
jgi:hypothetical protein